MITERNGHHDISIEDPIACTEALVTAVEERNDFGQYTLTILGIDQNGCYTNREP